MRKLIEFKWTNKFWRFYPFFQFIPQFRNFFRFFVVLIFSWQFFFSKYSYVQVNKYMIRANIHNNSIQLLCRFGICTYNMQHFTIYTHIVISKKKTELSLYPVDDMWLFIKAHFLKTISSCSSHPNIFHLRWCFNGAHFWASSCELHMYT